MAATKFQLLQVLFCFVSTLWAAFTGFCALMMVQLAKMFYIGWAFIAMAWFLTTFWFVHNIYLAKSSGASHAEHGSNHHFHFVIKIIYI